MTPQGLWEDRQATRAIHIHNIHPTDTQPTWHLLACEGSEANAESSVRSHSRVHKGGHETSSSLSSLLARELVERRVLGLGSVAVDTTHVRPHSSHGNTRVPPQTISDRFP